VKNLVGKSVKLKLQGLDGNAFNLLGKFQRQAQKEKWTKQEINMVMDEASAGDYNHLLQVLITHTKG